MKDISMFMIVFNSIMLGGLLVVVFIKAAIELGWWACQ